MTRAGEKGIVAEVKKAEKFPRMGRKVSHFCKFKGRKRRC
jgi:hypothetical protein